MFGKLLKYDFKYVARIWWMLAVGVLGLSVAASLVFRAIFLNINSNGFFAFLSVLGMFFLVVSFIGIFGSLVVTEVLVFVRFYKNFYTDEGYLTFTLPVKRSKLLLSKTLNSIIWFALHTALILVCVVIFLGLGIGSSMGTPPLKTVGSSIGWLWDKVGWWLIVYAVEAILLFVVLSAFTTCLVQLCITIGAIVAKKQKVLAAVGIYYLVNTVLSTVGSICLVVFLSGLEGFTVLLGGLSALAANVAIALVLLIAILASILVVLIVYFMTLGRIERKLNLA